MTDVPHCQQPVPEALSGDLRPSACLLAVDATGRHAGHHKAHLVIPNLGKVTFRWRNPTKVHKGPPEIKLPAPSGETLHPRAPYRKSMDISDRWYPR